MKMNLTDIVGKSKQFSCFESLHSLLYDATLDSPVDVVLTVRKKNEESYTLSGTINGSVTTACDRCGKVMPLGISREFEYALRIGTQPEFNAEYQCSNEDCETLYLAEAAIDSDKIIAEQFLLAIPVQRLCVESCRGLCNECGINLNKKKCQCGESNSNSPFAILKNLQQK